jgi:hypothetical protein
MDGTSATPEQYTGRAGIPAFREVGKVMILGIPTRAADGAGNGGRGDFGTGADFISRFRDLSAGRFATPLGNPVVRSRIRPREVMLPDGSACAVLEDTLAAKRFITGDVAGEEMKCAHLSCFAYRTPGAAAELVRAALAEAARGEYTTLFLSVPLEDAPALEAELAWRDTDPIRAPATLFGCGLPTGFLWNINTSEV